MKIILTTLLAMLLAWPEVASSQQSESSFQGRIADKYEFSSQSTKAMSDDYYSAVGGVFGKLLANKLFTTPAHTSYSIETKNDLMVQVAAKEKYEIGACVRVTAYRSYIDQGYIELGKAVIEMAIDCEPLRPKIPPPPIIDNGLPQKSGRPN